MSWFSNLFTNETVAIAASTNNSTATEPYAAVREKISNGKVAEQINILRNLLITLPISESNRLKYARQAMTSNNYYGRSRSWPHRQKMNDLLSLLSESISDIDVERSDMKTLFRIIDLCNMTLPMMIRELEIKIGQKNWSDELVSLENMAKAIDKMLAEIAVLPTRRSILNLDTPSGTEKAKGFPDISPYKENEELYTSLENLEKDWDKASELPLSAEDDYVIERVGNSYLPDALLLFDRFSTRTGSGNNQKALSIVKEQVSLIHQQVLFVLEQHEEDSFDLMETHTEFLKMKNARMGVPKSEDKEKLNLSKGSERSEPAS